jgi:cation transport protein ChaC
VSNMTDPFAHHPELRDLIADPETSFFRNFSVERVIEQFPQMEAHRDWPYTDTQREALRSATLSGHSGDLWVFGYGSLMWDPALRFAEVRRARVADHARRMILVDWRGGRGTEDAPGLMAALDEGPGCDGLAYRIPADTVDSETEILFRREMVAPGYHARFVEAVLDDGPVRALAFVADHSVPDIQTELSTVDQIRFIATGSGFLGSSRDYLANIVEHFEALGIHDEDCVSLLQSVDAQLSTQTEEPTP